MNKPIALGLKITSQMDADLSKVEAECRLDRAQIIRAAITAVLAAYQKHGVLSLPMKLEPPP